MKKIFICFITLIICANVVADNSPITKRKGRSKAVKKIMTTMTERQMIGQLFMINSYSSWDEYQLKQVYKQIDSNFIGGICFFKGNQKDLIRMNKLYNQRSKVPLFVAIDGEWGLQMRMTDGKGVPMAMTMGALKKENYSLVYDMGVNIAKQCKALGININFAPDVDININPDNPVINMRSFGQDKVKVAGLGKQYFSGMQSVGVMGVVKHFPGHGDTKTDSHKATPVITHSKDFIDSVDSYPFRYAIDNGVWGVMAGHLEVDALTTDSLVPASINKDIIDGYLVEDLDFKGLVFTDAMNMKGLTSRYGNGEAEVMAVLAGVDIILMPDNIDVAVDAVVNAVNEGRISRKLIREKCRKILNFKYDMGLLTQENSYSLPDDDVLQEADSLNEEIYQQALTLISRNNTLLSSDTIEVRGTRFSNSSSYYGVKKSEFKRLRNFCDSVTNAKTLVMYANAYFLKYIDSSYNFDNIVVAYEDNDFTRKAVSRLLKGEMTAEGILPVTARKEHVIIEEDTVKQEDLDYTLLKEMGIKAEVLKQIDSVVAMGIKEGAYPGCQVLIAKDGKIIFDKNYGYYTYDSLKAVNDNTMYDIASLTKVTATTLAVMKLYEQGKIDLDCQVKKYLPEFKHCKFAKLTVKELLSHYTTLPATYPFWTKTLKDGELDSDLYDYDVYMDEDYIPVTDVLFIKRKHLAAIRKQFKDIKLKDKQYTYSDLNFVLLQYIVEKISGQSLDVFLDNNFYAPLHLTNTFFNPLENGVNKEDIAPTEDEKTFRKQLIQGTVHDPTAALHGGVCGNAGVFSNAHDLYKICQMLLNNGELDGKRYLQKNTVLTFNKRYYKDKNIRRALGFDKPLISSPSSHCSKYASQDSYGHSGFTGTYLWIDPDNQTIVIFLSNRVYPSATPNKLASMNIRTDIHDIIYKALEK